MATDGAEVACCMMPCGIVHDNEPEGKRDGTLHTRLDGSQGSDKCGPCACSPTTTLYHIAARVMSGTRAQAALAADG